MRDLRYFIPALLILFTGCKQKEISSQPITQPIVIDGQYADWEGTWYYFDNFPATLAVANDSQFFYLCLKTSDRQLTRQIFSRGLIVSFNPEGKKKPALSISYPLGGPVGRIFREMNPDEQPLTRPDQRPFLEPQDRFGKRGKDFEPQTPEFLELEIRQGKGGTGVRYSIGQLTGLAVKIARQESELVYELRIPLSAKIGGTCTLNTKPGKSLAVGFKIPEIDLSAMRERFGGSGMPPRGGGMPPGGRGGEMGANFPGGQPSNRSMSANIPEIWFKVRI